MADNRDIIRDRILSNIDVKYDRNLGTYNYEIAQSLGLELENKYIVLEDSVNQKFAGTADFDNLKVIAFEKGVNWKPATSATGIVKIGGNIGATMNIGDRVANELNEYEATETKVIDSTGFANVNVKCVNPGIVGNTPVNTIIIFPKTLLGINTVTNELAFTNGYEEESREELLKRYYETIRRPATSGNVYHYEQWCKSVDGVGDVKVKPIWNGGGTVKCVIIDRNKQPASQELITKTSEYIETQRPIGAGVTVVAPSVLNINVVCSIQVKKDYTLEQAKTSIQNNLEQYFKDITFVDNNIYYAKIGSIIFDSDGVNNIDYTTLTINNAKNDIILIDTNANTQIPALGTLTITAI